MNRTHLYSRTEMAVVDKGGGVVEMVSRDEDEEEVVNGRIINFGDSNHESSILVIESQSPSINDWNNEFPIL